MYKFIIIIILVLAFLRVSEASDPVMGWMLMEAPSASDIHVENHSYQINGSRTLDDCLEMKATYTSDKHRWCEELIKPLDMLAELKK